jgi:hypothetical protein
MTVNPQIFYPLNSTVISVTGLQDFLSGAYLDAATVAATLMDEKGNADPVINSLPLTYIPASNGNYQGIVPNTFNATVGSRYQLKITALQGLEQAVWTFDAAVRFRTQ